MAKLVRILVYEGETADLEYACAQNAVHGHRDFGLVKVTETFVSVTFAEAFFPKEFLSNG